ncbi:uncharacterized protein [Antedon mediterranea]|uniref:uncharacterized protein n=1 Tax=Antedon mediterranea TaxID=105859 RepID=UPI003AF8DCAB
MPGLQDGKYRKYSQEVVRIACGRVRKGELSYGAAARMYGIPKSTIRDKVSGRTPIESTPGPDPILSKKEEEQLVGWAIGMAKIGYGRTMMEMKRVVKKFLDANGRPNPFVDNLPGRRWMRNFLRRHPELSMRLPETLGRERADVTVNKIQRWFRECSDYMVERKTERVIAPKGAKNVYQQTASTRQQITVVGACNATGQYIPPLIIFPGVRFAYDPLDGAPADSSFAKSKTGWMNSEIFYEYITNHFHPFVRSLNIPFPIILFVDGHVSHINLETADFF